jgi:hypothetical protein
VRLVAQHRCPPQPSNADMEIADRGWCDLHAATRDDVLGAVDEFTHD